MIKVLLNVSRIALYSMIALIIFDVGAFFGRYSDFTNPIEFFIKNHNYETGTDLLMKIQIAAYNQIIIKIWVALAFLVLYYVIDYFADPENHFITTLKKNYIKYKDGKI